ARAREASRRGAGGEPVPAMPGMIACRGPGKSRGCDEPEPGLPRSRPTRRASPPLARAWTHNGEATSDPAAQAADPAEKPPTRSVPGEVVHEGPRGSPMLRNAEAQRPRDDFEANGGRPGLLAVELDRQRLGRVDADDRAGEPR